MEERRCYPLSKAQEGLVLLAKVFPSPNILYLLCRIDFESEVSEERLLEAIRLTGMRLPYCRIRLHDMEDGSTKQYVSEEAPDEVQIYDLRDRSEKELDDLILQWQEEPFPNEQRDVQLYRFRLIRLPGGRIALHFVVHHFIMDAYAMMHTIRYLDQVYSALCAGSELPPEGPLPWKLLDEENSYLGSAKEEKDGAWWRAQFETEPRFCSINGLGGPEFVEGKRCGRKQDLDQLRNGLVTRRIPAEMAERVNRAARERNLSPQVYYMLALRSYLAYTNKNDDVTVVLPVAMRSTRYQKNAGFSIAKSVLIRTQFPLTIPFAEALLRVAEVEDEAFRHAKYSSTNVTQYLQSRYDVAGDGTYDSVWLTYQPYFDMGSSKLRFTARLLPSGFIPTPLYIMIQPQDDSGDLYALYDYGLGYTKEESCVRFHAFLLRFLELGAAEPEQPLEDLIRRSL